MTDWINLANTPNPMTNLRKQIRAHWARYRPKMYAAMEAEGTLDDAIENAAHQTEEAVINYTSNPPEGMTPAQAFWAGWETFREQWAFLPAEEGFDDDDDDEDDPELDAYYARLERFSAERSVVDIWDEKNERYITPFVWDEEKRELVPTGEWYEGLDPEWVPAEGFEDLYPSYPNEGEKGVSRGDEA